MRKQPLETVIAHSKSALVPPTPDRPVLDHAPHPSSEMTISSCHLHQLSIEESKHAVRYLGERIRSNAHRIVSPFKIGDQVEYLIPGSGSGQRTDLWSPYCIGRGVVLSFGTRRLQIRDNASTDRVVSVRSNHVRPFVVS